MMYFLVLLIGFVVGYLTKAINKTKKKIEITSYSDPYSDDDIDKTISSAI